VLLVERAHDEQCVLAGREGMRFEMRDTAADDGIISRCAGECRGGGVKTEDEPRDRRMSGAGDTQRARNQRKPLANQFGPMWPAVPFSDRADLRFVGWAGSSRATVAGVLGEMTESKPQLPATATQRPADIAQCAGS